MVNPEIVQDRIGRFPERCRAAGLKLTPQRGAVYAMLAGMDSHPTPETIYAGVREGMPSISQGTVYKILDLLCGRGLVSRVATAAQAARYDARTDSHSHALCTRCGQLSDMEGGALAGIDTPARRAAEAGFDVHKVELLVEGHCAACQSPSV